jgi:hypothetical protein
VRRITTIAFSTAMLATAGWIAGAHAQPTPPAQSAPAAPPDTSAPAQSAAPDTSAPADNSAPAEAPKPAKHHHMMHKSSKASKAEAGDAAVEDLNAKSLDDAKAGKSFAPPTPTPAAEAKPAAKPMHHHHVTKKPAAPPADSSAPAPDSTPK